MSKKTNIPLPSILQNPDVIEDVMQRYVIPTVAKNRALTINWIMGVVIVILVVSLASLFPLKENIPYYIQVNELTGEAKAVNAIAQSYEPKEAQIKFYANKFFEHAMTIEAGRVDYHISQARQLVRGKATSVFREQILEGMKPVFRSASDISLTQSYDAKGTNLLSEKDKTALVRFSTTERKKDGRPLVKDWQATVRYDVVTPKTEKEILGNPLGFYIVDFNLTEEVSKVNK